MEKPVDINEEIIITVKDIMLLITGLQQINQSFSNYYTKIPEDDAKETMACMMTEMEILLKLLPRRIGKTYLEQLRNLENEA